MIILREFQNVVLNIGRVKMSEKRFIFATNEKWFLFDNETEDFMDMEDCKDKLNEQQSTIIELQETIIDLKDDKNQSYKVIIKLRQIVCDMLNEQQVTIQKQSERIRELESMLADDIVRKSEIKDAWKQRTEKRWNDV